MTIAARRNITLLVILVIAVAIRAWGIETQSLSVDEIADTLNAKAPLATVIHTTDGFPPLFGLLFHGWFALFPRDDLARWLSVIVGTLSVLGMALLGAQAGGLRVGLAAAAALALSPFHIGFSQEARTYALYILWAVLALWLFFRAMATDRSTDWLWYALACTAGLYTHYYFVLLPATTGVLLLIERRGSVMVRGLAAHAAVVAAGVSVIPMLRADLAYQADYPHEAPFNLITLAYAYFSTVVGFNVGPSLRELHYLPTTTGIRMVLPWAVTGGAAVVALAWSAWRHLRLTPDGRVTAVRLAVLTTVPVFIGGILADVAHVGFRVRYLAWIVVPLMVIIAAGAVAPRTRWIRVGAVALLLIWATALANRRWDQRYWNEDAAGAARYLQSVAKPANPVFVMSNYMAVPVAYYLGPGWHVCPVPNLDAEAVEASRPLRVISTVAAPDSIFWLVYSRPFHSDPDGYVRRALVNAAAIRPKASFAGVTLYEGRTRMLRQRLPSLGCEDVRGLREAPTVRGRS